MDSVVPVAAPAPLVAESTISASQDAATRGDFAAFEAAETAKLAGKPLAAVPVEAKTDPVEPPERQVSKRQQQINDYERQLAELKAENTRLKTAPAPPAHSEPPARVEAKVDPPTAPKTHLDAIKAPDASKPMLSEAEFFAAFPDAPYAAYGRYWGAYDAASERVTATRDATERETIEAQTARIDTFLSRLEAAKTADPEFVTKLSPEVKRLKPISGLADGEPSGPLNVLWEQVYDSPVVDRLLLHFSAHPDELRRFETLPAEIAKLPASQRARAHIPWLLREFGKLEARFDSPAPAAPVEPRAQPNTISNAPPPAPTLTRPSTTADPKTAAVARGDFDAFDRQEMAKEHAKRRGA